MDDERKEHILFVDDDKNCLDGFARGLRHRHKEFRFSMIDCPEQALSVVNDTTVDVIVTDMQMPKMSGLDFLRHAQGCAPFTPRLILSGAADLPTALTVINDFDVFKFLTKPCDSVQLSAAIDEALQYRNDCVAKERETFKSDAALDCLSIGFLAVDADGTVHHANQKGKNILRSKDGLIITPHDQCRASTPADTRKLRQLISEACEQKVSMNSMTVTNFARTSLKRDFTIFVAPFPNETFAQPQAPLTGLFIIDPEEEANLEPETIARLFGLTLTEAKIVCDLVAGQSLECAAQRAEITMNTARTYMKRIFAKTATSKQSQLTNLIIRSTFGIQFTASLGAH